MTEVKFTSKTKLTNRESKGLFPKLTLFILLFSAFFFICCANGDSDSDDTTYIEKRIAVFLPITTDEATKQSSDGTKYKETIEWCLDNYRSTRSKAGINLEFKIDYYDENAYLKKRSELSELAATLAADKDICAIIGPMGANNATLVANACLKTEKPLILPNFSANEYLRRYSVSSTGSIKRPFLWSLTESDVSQCEVAMSKISSELFSEEQKEKKRIKISVLACADIYGDTFHTSASFFATEMNLELLANIRYKPSNYSSIYDMVSTPPVDKEKAYEQVLSSGAEVVLCAMNNTDDAEQLLKAADEREKNNESCPDLFFTDSLLSSELLNKNTLLIEGLEGTAPYVNPINGFVTEYEKRFNEKPIRGVAQLYDSILFVLYASIYQSKHPADLSEFTEFAKDENRMTNIAMNEALKKVATVETNDYSSMEYINDINNSWSKIGMLYMLRQYNSGDDPIISGASGTILFDAETYTTMVYTTYIHWVVVDTQFILLDYLSTSGGRRTSQVRSIWAWERIIDKIDDPNEIEYKATSDSYAILIAASSGWKNYRHQADVLNMYRYLSNNGFDDDHIIMIIQDDIANNKNNTADKGNIRVSPSGENLYTEKAQKGIDGHPSELTPKDIQTILLGDAETLQKDHKEFSQEKIKRLTYNAPKDNTVNLFLFWSGHGANRDQDPNFGQLFMANPTEESDEGVQETGFTTELLKETMEKMEQQKTFRKFLIVNESCYGKSVFNAVTGYTGVLAYTAANGQETSFTDVRNSEMKIWMTNRFTRNFMNCLESETNRDESNNIYAITITYYDLYDNVAKKTVGSHVCIINTEKFGPVKQKQLSATPTEFLIYRKRS